MGRPRVTEPLLPPWPGSALEHGRSLTGYAFGILFVLHTGIGWENLPLRFRVACWPGLKRWTEAGVFDRLHRLLLAELNAAGRTAGRGRRWTAVTSTRRMRVPG